MTMRALLYDIETTPNLAFVWGHYETDVLAYAAEWHMLSFAYKWLGEPDVQICSQRQFRKDYKADPSDDRRVVERLHELFTEADVVIAHNGNAFDQKKANARFVVHGLAPPAPYAQIDTCLLARKYFGFNSNKLNDLGKTLGLGEKLETGGFKTWLGCMNGDRTSWERMEEYNKKDVLLLEQVYLKLRPWMEGHPHVGLLNNELTACPNCGSASVMRQGVRKSRTMTYQRWQCRDCGAWSRSRMSEKVKRPSLIN